MAPLMQTSHPTVQHTTTSLKNLVFIIKILPALRICIQSTYLTAEEVHVIFYKTPPFQGIHFLVKQNKWSDFQLGFTAESIHGQEAASTLPPVTGQHLPCATVSCLTYMLGAPQPRGRGLGLLSPFPKYLHPHRAVRRINTCKLWNE